MRPTAVFVPILLLLLAVPRAHAQDPADQAWQAGDHTRARLLYAERLAADSSNVQALHRLGLLLAWNREYAGAIRLFDRLISVQPSGPAQLDRANVLAWSGRFDDAERAFRALLERDPSSADAMFGLARVASWRGDLASGEQLWRDAVAARPEDANARVGLSQVLRWGGRPGAALREAEAAVRLAPDNGDAREQLAWAQAAFRPRFAPSVAAEFDSDDNRLITTALSASAHLGRRLAVTAHGYVRDADDARPDAGLGSRALSLGARLEIAEGWTLAGTGGVTERRFTETDTDATFSASLASPSWQPVAATAGVTRHVLDATALLVERGVVIDEANVGLTFRLSPALRLEGGAAVARFRGNADNDRVLGRLGLEARVSRSVRIRPRVTAFRFEDDLDEGYFDPDFYGLAELGVGLDRYQGDWSLSAEVAPGAQQVGTDGAIKASVGMRARVGYTIAPGREIGVGFTFSNLGIERFEANASGYRYQAALISAGWAF